MTDVNNTLMTPDDAAAYLTINKRQLQLDRTTKRNIPFIKIGRLVRYSKADLDTFICKQTVGGNATKTP